MPLHTPEERRAQGRMMSTGTGKGRITTASRDQSVGEAPKPPLDMGPHAPSGTTQSNDTMAGRMIPPPAPTPAKGMGEKLGF